MRSPQYDVEGRLSTASLSQLSTLVITPDWQPDMSALTSVTDAFMPIGPGVTTVRCAWPDLGNVPDKAGAISGSLQSVPGGHSKPEPRFQYVPGRPRPARSRLGAGGGLRTHG